MINLDYLESISIKFKQAMIFKYTCSTKCTYLVYNYSRFSQVYIKITIKKLKSI